MDFGFGIWIGWWFNGWLGFKAFNFGNGWRKGIWWKNLVNWRMDLAWI